MGRGIAFALTAVVVGAAAACSLSLDGFSSGAEQGSGGGDASSTPPPPGTPPPGTPPTGASAPPPPSGDASAGDPCDGAIFCDTFDNGALGATWDAVRNNDAGSIALDTSTSISAPNSVFATVPAGTTGAYHYLTKAITAPSTSDIDMEVDIRLDAACEGHIAEIGIDKGASTFLFHLELDSAGTTVTLSQTNSPVDGGTAQTDLANGVTTLPIGTWVHVRLRANVAAKIGEYYVNGALVKSVTLAPIVTSGTPHFRAVIASQDNGVGCSVHMDNVAVRAR